MGRKKLICPECGRVFLGRLDQIFCSVKCKSSYHNKKRDGGSVEGITKEKEERSINNETKLTIVTCNEVIINIIKQICHNNNIKVCEEEVDNLPYVTPDKDGKFRMDGKMLYTSSMIASMIGASSKNLSSRAGFRGIYPIARGPVARVPRANLYSEEDAFKIMEALDSK